MSAPGDRITWARLLTPAGVGAIAVVRVAGPSARAVVESLFEPARPGNEAAAGPDRLRYGRLVEAGETLDDVILAVPSAPADTPAMDISLHGGVRVVTRVLLALERRGVLVADPAKDRGSPSAWPADNRIEVEADEALVQASTPRAVRVLAWQRRQLPGVLRDIRDRARTDPAGARAALQSLWNGYEAMRLLREGARVAVVGPPNAGKSTLTNRLAGWESALTGEEAGSTLDWTTHGLSIDGVPLTVIDTAGVHGPWEELVADAMARGLRQAADADLVLAVLDGSRPVPEAVWRICQEALRPGRWLAVINKSDLPGAWCAESIPQGFAAVLPVSARTGEGLAALRSAILSGLGIRAAGGLEPALFRGRQARLVGAGLRAGPFTADRVGKLVAQLLGEG